MPRVKRAVIHLKKRRKVMARAKGYMWRRSNLWKQAKVATLRAGAFAYRDRRNKKRAARALWQIRINAGVRALGLTYSRFIDKLKKAGIIIDRKILATLAAENPKIFEALVKQL